MATEVRMTIRLPKEADRFLAKVAKADFTSKNAQIVRIIRDAMRSTSAASTGEGLPNTAPVEAIDHSSATGGPSND